MILTAICLCRITVVIKLCYIATCCCARVHVLQYNNYHHYCCYYYYCCLIIVVASWRTVSVQN